MDIEKKKWLYAIGLVIATGLAIVCCPPVFYLNDDVTMRSILSGAYTGTPNGHAVYMQYPLTGVLALLYRVAGGVPWLELFFTLCLVVCMMLLMRQFPQPIVGCLIALVLYVPFCLYMHYTLVAALIAGTAVFLLTTGKRNWVPFILLIIAYMIRSQIGLLSLPFVACALVWQVVTVPRETWKSRLLSSAKYCAVLAGGMLVCTLIHSACYSSAEWKAYLEYNDSRTLLYDYTDFLSTDKYEEEYASYGMTAEEYAILKSYDTMLDGEINTEKMYEVAQTVSEGMKQDVGLGQSLKECVRKYYNQIRYSDAPYNYIWLGAYVLLAVGFLLCKKWLNLLILGMLGIGRSCVWMFLIWKGRFPERVSLSLYVLELLILLGMGLWLVESLKTAFVTQKFGNFVVAVLALVLVIFGAYQWKATTAKVQYQAGIQKQWNVLKDYCEENPKRLYLIDVFSVVEYAGMQYEKDARNMMLLGGWMSANPLAGERFAVRGCEDGAECLYYDKDVSLIVEAGSDMSWLENYLQNRFGECKLEVVSEISSREPKYFLEYRVVRTD